MEVQSLFYSILNELNIIQGILYNINSPLFQGMFMFLLPVYLSKGRSI